MPVSNEHRRRRYAEDSEYRQRELEASRRYHAAHKAEINERKRRKWATDPEYRAKGKARVPKDKATRAKRYRARLLKRYGMSSREYELRLALQNGACAICRKEPKRRLLCIDHCHKTGKVRGLLCTPCNAALGAFADDPRRMQAATDYLTAFYASLEPRGNVVISTDERSEAGKAGRLLREAILLELQRERGAADDGATGKLRLIARRLVEKAAEGDIQAIKEVLARTDGKSVPGTADAEQGARPVSIRSKTLPSDAAGTPATPVPPGTGSGATAKPIC